MKLKQGQRKNQLQLAMPASAKPRNPFVGKASMRRGVIRHGKSQKEQRHIDNMRLRHQLRAMDFDDS